ncbi:MAG: AtzE family amidohydrolase [Betaproteobacteria bacterium]|nr:AtzE family amidohydrolase [Betaproteobacteria bacterium]
MNRFVSALDIAAVVRSGDVTAKTIVSDALSRIAADNKRINAFTRVTEADALRDAAAVDAAIAAGRDAGPLAGVPFAVKNLFDVQGEVTLAGSRINAANAAAIADATAVRRLREAGAVLVGLLNMDEYAYGFTTENSHYGATRNPHDLSRIAGGSSGGSAAAVAGALVPLTLGTDTNGSIRVPSALCGVFGLKPTYGRLSRAGVFPFVGSLDHVGPFARSTADLAAAYDAIQGADARDPMCASRAMEPTTPQLGLGIEGLRIGLLGGYFERNADENAWNAVVTVARAAGVAREVQWPEVERARAAAFIITAAEGGQLHLPNLRAQRDAFDPLIRDRLTAGALTPGAWYVQAQRLRRWFRDRAREVFRDVDVLLAPTAPCAATSIGQETMTLRGREIPLRPNMGLLTQPLSFIGLPIVAAPLVVDSALPLGLQIIAPAWREDLCVRVSAALQARGLVCAKPVQS